MKHHWAIDNQNKRHNDMDNPNYADTSQPKSNNITFDMLSSTLNDFEFEPNDSCTCLTMNRHSGDDSHSSCGAKPVKRSRKKNRDRLIGSEKSS